MNPDLTSSKPMQDIKVINIEVEYHDLDNVLIALNLNGKFSEIAIFQSERQGMYTLRLKY